MGHEHENERLVCAVSSIAVALEKVAEAMQRDLAWRRSHADLATKQDLDRMECKIMGKIGETSERLNTKLDTIGTDVDTLVTGVGGIATDVTFLKDTITKLQNTPGTVTPEDQALLDALEARIGGLSDKVKSASDQVAALDAATEPAPTDVPPTP